MGAVATKASQVAKMNPMVARNELAKRDADKAAKKSKLEQAALEEINSQLGTAGRLVRKSSVSLAEKMPDKYLREAAAVGGGKRRKIKSKKRTKRRKQKTKRRKNHTKKNRTKKNRTKKNRTRKRR